MLKLISKHKTDKNGFSLLEVILSVALIGIVFVSLMRYFSSSIQANNYAKGVQKASLAAQAIMEELDGLPTIEGIAKEYNGSTHTGWDELDYNPGSGYMLKTPKSHDGTTFTPSNTYYFTREIQVDGTNYKALITIDTTPYNAMIPGKPAQYNTLNIPVISDMNSDSNAIIVEGNQNVAALAEFSTQNTSYVTYQWTAHHVHVASISDASIQAAMTRELVINVTDSGAQTRIEAHYHYECSVDPRFTPYDSIPLLDQYLDNNLLKSVYYFYDRFKTEEPITINGTSGTNYNFHVVCQNPTSARAEITGDISNIADVYTNVQTKKNGISIGTPILIRDEKKQRYADVLVQIFNISDPITSANVLAEIKTTRGE